MMEGIPAEKYYFLYFLHDPVGLLLCPTKSRSRRSLARVKLLQKEKGRDVRQLEKAEFVLRWTTESVA